MSSLPRKPRKWTVDQVQFVLELVDTEKSQRQIATLFNNKYNGNATIDSEQVKYLKAQYRNRNQPARR